jgi:hypothetical protein
MPDDGLPHACGGVSYFSYKYMTSEKCLVLICVYSTFKGDAKANLNEKWRGYTKTFKIFI